MRIRHVTSACVAVLLVLLMLDGRRASAASPGDATSPSSPSKKSSAGAKAPAPVSVSSANRSPDPARLRAHVAFLADDLLEGRGPGTRGGRLAESYVATTMAVLGLKPAGEDGSYFQKVPLVGVTRKPGSTLGFTSGSTVFSPKALDEMIDWTDAQKEVVDVAGDVVFVGYGVEAPEYRWDDFKGLDVKGKVILMLVNDPPATAAEPDLFKGKALTYYGRWTYKFEQAGRHGAAAAYLVHTDSSAGYGWDVVRNSWSGEKSQNRLDSSGPAPLQAAGWLSEQFARQLLKAAGQDFDSLRKAAASREFHPVALPLTATAHMESSLRPFEARNVAGRLAGKDPKRAGEAVLFTAHLDHFGIGRPDETGDAIYNGAVDNASGVATMLEVARVAAASGGTPRTLLFVAVTGEEQGLKGSDWYAHHPLVPAGKTAVCVNMDGGRAWGPYDDYVIMGSDRSPELDRIANAVAKEMHFTIKPDLHPEQGYFYRSDHFSLAKVGVPCLNLEHGNTLRGQPKGIGDALETEYREKRYHRPADQLDGVWDFSGLVQYATLAWELGRRVAAEPALPRWKAGDEFEAARLASLK
jgi:Zn-dependent M28 family amino/carboxypeptidase